METTIKSKPTRYNGYEFRSRLEARWAVFFDALGVKYHYEYQDFILPDGTRYLPDFYLLDFYSYGDNRNFYAEVKPDGGFTEEAKQKCEQLCRLTEIPVLMLEGVPDFKYFYWFRRGNEINEIEKKKGVVSMDRPGKLCRLSYNGYYDPLEIDENFFKGWGDDFIDAVYSSRAAKFEFGQNGK